MNELHHVSGGKIGFVLCAALVGALTGCIGYVDRPSHGAVTVYPPVQAETAIVVEDDYVYYPGYQVYYSSNRRQYVYLEGRSWVTRPAPPRVSVDVLLASPSVRLDFHDSPSRHHGTVIRQYPQHWSPPESNRGNKEDRGQGRDQRNDKDNKKDNKKGDKGRD